MFIKKTLDTEQKLSLLSDDAKYDIACSCGITDADKRHRSQESKWIYPVALPNGGQTTLFKTLVSNTCVNDCKYCPLRKDTNIRRCVLRPEELAKSFMDYYTRREVFGLFLSSGIIGNSDNTMEQINRTASIVRKKGFHGYMHLKIVPGASDAAIKETVSLASSVSINIESPEKNFKTLCTTKDYISDIIRPLKTISKLTARGMQHSNVKHTTQFIVGASDEKDKDIVEYMWGLYKRLGLSRVYFSAYQRGAGRDIPGEISSVSNADMLVREHRLYQVDWLIRKYGFSLDEIAFDTKGDLSLTVDPKEQWARNHPEFFPVDINQADKNMLLRVPGFGEISVNKILKIRQNTRIRYLETLEKAGIRINKAKSYINLKSCNLLF